MLLSVPLPSSEVMALYQVMGFAAVLLMVQSLIAIPLAESIARKQIKRVLYFGVLEVLITLIHFALASMIFSPR